MYNQNDRTIAENVGINLALLAVLRFTAEQTSHIPLFDLSSNDPSLDPGIQAGTAKILLKSQVTYYNSYSTLGKIQL